MSCRSRPLRGTNVVVVLALLAQPVAARAQETATASLDLGTVLEPLVAAAEQGIDADPTLALARAELTLASVPESSWLHARAGSIVFRARLLGADLARTPPAIETVLEPLITYAGTERAIRVARLDFVEARIAPDGALADRVRGLRDDARATPREVVPPSEVAPPSTGAPLPPATSHAVAPGELLVGTAPRPEAARSRAFDCRSRDRRERLQCRRDQLEEDLFLREAELATQTRADDTAPLVMVGVGITVVLGGVGTLVYTLASELGTLAFIPGAFALAGLVSTIIGGIWLKQNGAPWRRRDALRRQIQETRRSLLVSVGGSPDGASVALSLAF